MILAFHEIKKDEVEGVLKNGLLLGRKGHKRDNAINQTDAFLNRHRPAAIKNSGLDRMTNIYCYLSDDNYVIDIASGIKKPPAQIIDNSQQQLLSVQVDPERSYVSDLELYDHIKSLVQSGKVKQAKALARVYWATVVPLARYNHEFRRPELVIPYAIQPNDISK